MLLYDRARISQKNEWLDELVRVFVVYPIAELSEKMSKCRSSVKNALKELEDAGQGSGRGAGTEGCSGCRH